MEDNQSPETLSPPTPEYSSQPPEIHPEVPPEAPAKIPFFQRQIRMVVLLIVAASAVLLVGALGVLLGLQINQSHTFEKQAGTYKATLLSTQEGKEELEAANAKLNDQNTDLGQQASDANQKAADAGKQAADASQQAADANQQASNANQKASDASQQASDAKSKEATAEQSAADAKKKLDAANQELQSKLSEVQKVTNDLNARKADLDKANRGIAKFSDLEKLFKEYDDSAGEYMTALNNAYQAVLNQDRTAYNSNVSKLKTYASYLEEEYQQITGLFDDIRNNNY